jgi:tetratricopeptide (TPR) repeat protein
MEERYPEGTTASIDDFRRSGWKAAIESSEREDYHSMWSALSRAASAALASGDASQAKVLWLLADACSMMLKPASVNEPFQPIMVMEGKRTALPEDFKDPDVDLLAEISEEVNDHWLRARLADISWLLKKPRNQAHALRAIDSYRSILLDAQTWTRGGQECWERAISLTRSLRTAAGDRIQKIEADIIKAFNAASEDDGFLALWLADLLLASGFGKDWCAATADRLGVLARVFDQKGELHQAREFFEAAGKWYKRAGDEVKAIELTIAVAEGWVKEATAQTSLQRPSYMVATSFYENAIKVYRSIPRKQREFHKVEERIAELYRLMSMAGERSFDEMGVIESPSIDISGLVEDAREQVTGKSARDALLALANIHPGFRVANVRRQAEKVLREHPLLALIPGTHISRDGRVIAKRPGMGAGGDDFNATVWAEMVKNFGLEVGLIVQARVIPALAVVLVEHRLREADFVMLAKQSPIVPPARERLFGKALFLGYERKFAEALHLLVPQVENMVRAHLKAASVKTTSLDSQGIENEIGLSSLMDRPEVEKIFGPDIAFELRALFCDPLGPNLRNEIAHGLLDDHHIESISSVYAWWLGLKLVFNTFWNSLQGSAQQSGDEKDDDEEESEGDEE